MSDALNTQQRPFAIWLVPRHDQRTYLQGIIQYLCTEHSTHVFEPHCTIVSGNSSDINTVITQTRSIVPSILPVILSILKINSTDEFFKTLFIELEPNRELTDIFHTCKTAVVENHTDVFLPHVSLLYKEMELDKKRALASTIEIPLTEISFDAIKVVCPVNRDKGWYDISSWETMFEEKLTE